MYSFRLSSEDERLQTLRSDSPNLLGLARRFSRHVHRSGLKLSFVLPKCPKVALLPQGKTQ